MQNGLAESGPTSDGRRTRRADAVGLCSRVGPPPEPMANDPSGRTGDPDSGTDENGTDRPRDRGSDSDDAPDGSDGDPRRTAGLPDERPGGRDRPATRDRQAGDAPAPALTTDRLFELLSSPGNRFVLTYLLRVDGPVAYADLVEYVVDRAGPPDEMTEAKFRGRIAATLLDETLPSLADAGLVDVDGAGQRVSPTPATTVAAPYLALALSDLVGPADDHR